MTDKLQNRWDVNGCLASIPIYTKTKTGGYKTCMANFGTLDEAKTFVTNLWADLLANNAKPGLRVVQLRPNESDYEIPKDKMNLLDECDITWKLTATGDQGEVLPYTAFFTIPCCAYSKLTQLKQLVDDTRFVADYDVSGEPRVEYNVKEIVKIIHHRV